MSCDSFYNNMILYNNENGRRVKKVLLNGDSFISVDCQLLKSKVSVRPSQVIFTIEVSPKNTNLYFDSNKVDIVLFERESGGQVKLVATHNSLPERNLKIEKRTKYKVYATFNQFEENKSKNAILGLQLPSIVVENKVVDFERIDFGFY